MIRFSESLADGNLADEDRVAELVGRGLEMFYLDVPTDWEEAVRGLLWFYRCGREDEEPREEGKSGEPLLSYTKDAPYIYADFWAQYGVDLQTVTLHWWQFQAMFQGLSEERKIVQIMGIRGKDTRGLPREEKQRYEALKRQYALNVGKSRMTYQEYKQSMLDYVSRRFADCQPKEKIV